MSPHPPTTFRVDPELLAGLHALKQRDGIPLSEQVRRAIQMWLDAKGVTTVKSERERTDTRKRRRPHEALKSAK
jgi:ribbon-helix-helix protein